METFSTLSDLQNFQLDTSRIKTGNIIAIIGDNDELAQRVILDLCFALRAKHRFAKVFSRRLQSTEFYKSIVPTPFINHGHTLKDNEAREDFRRWFEYHRKQYTRHGPKMSTFLFLDEVVTDGDKNNKDTAAVYDQFFDVKDIGITTIIRAKDGITGIPLPLKKIVDYTFILNNSADMPKLQKQYAYMMFEKPQVLAGLIAACHPLQCLLIEREPAVIDNDCIVQWLNHIKKYECNFRREVEDVKLCSSRLWHFMLKENVGTTSIDKELDMYSRLMHNCAQTTGKKLLLRIAK